MMVCSSPLKPFSTTLEGIPPQCSPSTILQNTERSVSFNPAAPSLAQGDLPLPGPSTGLFSSFSLLRVNFTVMEVVLQVQAPPATISMQEPQGQTPIARLVVLVLPQKEQVYQALWLSSTFFTISLKEAPQWVPHLPMIPTFLVHVAMLQLIGASGGYEHVTCYNHSHHIQTTVFANLF